MSFANDILDAIEIMVKQVVEDNATKIYTGVCKTIGTGNCILTINGKDNTVKYYGGVPVVGTVYQVFIPFGNMSAAFIIVPGSGGESGGSGVDSVNGKTGDVTLNAADVGLGNVDNIKQYSASNPPPYPVISVNGKTGNVNLTANDIGAAPAGYGLGAYAASLPSTNLDSITYNGWYVIGRTSGLTNPPPFGWGVLHVYARNYKNLVQEFKSGQSTVRRYSVDGTWQPWEWVNPPMQLGVEYRTTERYQGKPVYVKSLSMGNMPAVSTTKSVTFGTGTEIAIEVTGRIEYESDTYTIPFDRGNGTYAKIYAHNSQVFLMNGEQSLSAYNVFATVKYIKTTD